MDAALADFAQAYAEHRAEEGRGQAGEDPLHLPYPRSSPFARQWAVRARTYETLARRVVLPLSERLLKPLRVLDLGAGSGWLSFRMALGGHSAIALDIRDDAVDGLAAADPLIALAPDRMRRLTASFEAIPLPPGSVDLAVFNASLHYAVDLGAALAEATRVVRPGGQIVIADSPFYRSDRDGEAMAQEKRAQARERFGERAEILMGLDVVEYLTRNRLRAASAGLPLAWRRRRVGYPLWYELRPLEAFVRRRRAPSRFDLWVSERR